MITRNDIECMSLALRLAKQGQYTARPNPIVGCVIIDNQGQIVGRGYHQKYGGPHAEIHALQDAGAKSKGATAYVTLEPCCHHGKTGPCTEALINAGISKVVMAMQDPNPLVAGNGSRRLSEHGITVINGVCEEEAKKLNRGFIYRMLNQRPWVTVKTAISLDGRTALNNGHSKWITSEAARKDVQYLRAKNDAIITGVGTVLADDPSLNVRLSEIDNLVQPIRVIIDPELKTPTSAKIFSNPGHTLVFTHLNNHSYHANNCEVITVESEKGMISPRAILSELANREINSVLVESGAKLAGSFISHRCVDELITYIAPKIMGDTSKGAFSLGELTDMNECQILKYTDIRQVGEDIRITSQIKN